MRINDLRDKLEDLIRGAIESARDTGKLDVSSVRPRVEIPRDPSHGDFSTNAAMMLAKKAGLPPRKVAGILLEHFEVPEGFLESEPQIAGPGFMNFRLSARTWLETVARVIEAGDDYGKTGVGGGEKVLVEFVSANPTGPLHIGHARGAAVGDSLSRMLDAAGFNVQREFYVNDAGVQVDTLAKSLHCRYLELLGRKIEYDEVFPDGNYYPGEYVVELAGRLKSEKGDEFESIPPGDYDPFERRFAAGRMMEEIKSDLESFRVRFDNWFCESTLYSGGEDCEVERAVGELMEKGDIYEKDGAVWFRSSKYGDEKDRVVRKSNGEWTYFAGDIAYHRAKLRRGFERLVNIWGADHHGYIGRVKASLEALGFPPEKLQVLLVQMVNLVRGGEPVRMGKRSGTFVTLREVMDEVGTDAMRFTFLTRGSASHLDFDIDVLKSKPGEDSELKMSQLREKNPVYYVQYAHARCRSIFRKAAELGTSADSPRDADLSELALPEEIDLARKMESFPREVAEAATAGEPHRLSHYLIEMAGDFHRYYYRGDRDPACRVLAESDAVRSARLALVAALARVLKNGLNLLGVDAPERM